MIGARIPCSATGSVLATQGCENLFELKYHSFRTAQLRSGQPYYLNLCKFLYDREIECLDLIGNDWNLIAEMANRFANGTEHEEGETISSSRLDLRPLWACFLQWTKQLQASKDAESDLGRNFILARIKSLYLRIVSESDEYKRCLLEVIAKNSSKCPDRAVVGLEKVELIAQLMSLGDDFMINILVLAFKRHLISTELVPLNSKESVETYLYYSILLDEILMLKNGNKLMLYPESAVKQSTGKVLDKLFGRLTIEDLEGFVADNKIFRKRALQENDEDTAVYLKELAEIQEAVYLLDPGNLEMGALKNRREITTDNFFKSKARKYLIQKGFITKDVNYEDPGSFPFMPRELSLPTNNMEEETRQWGVLRNEMKVELTKIVWSNTIQDVLLMIVCIGICFIDEFNLFYSGVK